MRHINECVNPIHFTGEVLLSAILVYVLNTISPNGLNMESNMPQSSFFCAFTSYILCFSVCTICNDAGVYIVLHV